MGREALSRKVENKKAKKINPWPFFTSRSFNIQLVCTLFCLGKLKERISEFPFSWPNNKRQVFKEIFMDHSVNIQPNTCKNNTVSNKHWGQGYTNLPNSFLVDPRLDTIERNLMAIIFSFHYVDEKKYTHEYLATLIGVSKKTVQRRVESLKNKGFLRVDYTRSEKGDITGYNIVPCVKVTVKIEKIENESIGVGSESPGGQVHESRGSGLSDHQITNNITNNITNICGDKSPRVAPEDQVIDYLNKKTKSKFGKVESNRRLIRAILKDYPLNALLSVIDYKTREWAGTKLEKYLRPSTLFSRAHFDEYLAEASKTEKMKTSNEQKHDELQAELASMFKAPLPEGLA